MKIKTNKKEYKLIRKATHWVLYEGGYWMDRKDWDFVNFDPRIITGKLNVGLETDKDTKQIKYYFLPEKL